MQSFVVAWQLLLLLTIFAFPLLLAILLYFRLSRAPRLVATIATILAPAVFFVFLAPIHLFAGMSEAQARGASCGMPAMGAILLLYAGTALQLVLGLFTLAALSARRRHQVSANQT
jgi:hypothetical protein